MSWSPHNGLSDRSGRSSSGCPPNSPSPGTVRPSRGVSISARKRARLPPAQQPPETRRVPERLAVEHHWVARLRAPPELPDRYVRHARHDPGAAPSARSYLRTTHGRTALTTSSAATTSASPDGALLPASPLGQTRYKLLADHHLRAPFRYSCRRRHALLPSLVSTRPSAAAG
jgi:hypothetical protein